MKLKKLAQKGIAATAVFGLTLGLSSCGGGGEAASPNPGTPPAEAPREEGSGESAPAQEGKAKLVIKGSDTLGAKMVPQLAET